VANTSIIIPTFNRAGVLNRVLPTYLIQDQVLEVIIVNDGSTDNTEEIIQYWQDRDSRVLCRKHGKRRGQPAARNTGMASARGAYLFFGEDDVILNTDTLALLHGCMAQKSADIAGCRTMYMAAGETPIQTTRRYNALEDPFFDMASFRFNFGCRSAAPVKVPFLQTIVLLKSDVAHKICFDERYRGSAYREETDFFIRCSKAGYILYSCPEAMAFNLPRTETAGGAHALTPWHYELSAIANNWRFLKNHYHYLHNEWGLAVPRLTLQARFTRERLRMLWLKIKARWLA
jgi:glycosyltransferase involved in cell wall biosynthesis